VSQLRYNRVFRHVSRAAPLHPRPIPQAPVPSADAGSKIPSGVRVLLGGAALSSIHSGELMRACPFVDAVLLGEGELSLLHLHDSRLSEALLS